MQYFFYTPRIYLPYCLAHLLYILYTIIYRKTNQYNISICVYTDNDIFHMRLMLIVLFLM